MTEKEYDSWIGKYKTFIKYYENMRSKGIQMKQKPSLDAFVSAYKTKVAESAGSHNIPRDVATGYAKVTGKSSRTIANKFVAAVKEYGIKEFNYDNKFGPQSEKIMDEINKSKNPRAAIQALLRKDPSIKDILFQMGNKADPRLFQKKAYKNQSGERAKGVTADPDGIKYYYVPTWIYSPD